LEERTKIAKRVESHISKFLKDLKQYNPEKWQSWEKAVGEIEIVTEVNVSPEGTAHQYGYNKIRCLTSKALTLLDTLPKSVKNFTQGQIIVCQGEVYLVSNHFILLQPQPDKTVIENFCHKDTVENRKALANEVERIVSNHNEEIRNKHFPNPNYVHNAFIDLSMFNNDIKKWDRRGGELETKWPVKNGTVVITTNPKNIYIKSQGRFKQLDIFSKEELEDIKTPNQQGLREKLAEKISSYNVNLKKGIWLSYFYKCCDPKLATEREKRMRSERGYLDEVEIYFKGILKDKNNVMIRIGCCQECQARAIDFRMLPMATVSLKDEKNQSIELTRPPSPVGTTKMLEGNHLPFQTSVDWFWAEAYFQMKTANTIKVAEDKKNESVESLTKQRQKELCHERAIFHLNHAISAIRIQEKKLIHEDFFTLAQLYECRATQKKVLGFQDDKNDLIIAHQYYKKTIDHFKRECKSLTGNIQNSPLGTQERAYYFMQRAKMRLRLQKTYNRCLKVVDAKEKASYVQAVEKCKQCQRRDTLASYDNTIRYYLGAANQLDASIQSPTTACAAYLQLSDFYAKISGCVSQDSSRIKTSGDYLELAKIYAAIAGLLLKESQLSQQSHAILGGWRQEKINNFEALHMAAQDLIRRKSQLNIPFTTGDAFLSSWAPQSLDFWIQQQDMKNTIPLTRNFGSRF